MARDASIGIRVEKIVKDAAEKAAKSERRTLAAYVEGLIVADLESRKLLKPGAAE